MLHFLKSGVVMVVRLEKATDNDAQSIFDIQVKAFMPLLGKCKILQY